jgi:hypothetical protein
MRYIVKRYLRARLAHVTRHNLTGAFGFITAGPPVTTVTASPAFLRASFRDRTRPPVPGEVTPQERRRPG